MAKFNITLHVNLEVDDKYLEQWNHDQKVNYYMPYEETIAQELCDFVEEVIYNNNDKAEVTYEIN